ncbi:MAG: rRNA maturation RNase YbeY [Lachnospiraceae bacterium]|nr:rRNA maturation RNase YbeY [Lachnospiraceae bacterium]
MNFELENETGIEFDFDPYECALSVIKAAVDSEGCPYECEICLTITDDEGIQDLNSRLRGIDAPTDVLSFPLIEYDRPADFGNLENESPDLFNPDTGDLMLGDIVINAKRVFSQAEEYGHSRKREFCFLVAHSMLHLFGYDHMEDEEREVMEKKQEDLLKSLGITRGD